MNELKRVVNAMTAVIKTFRMKQRTILVVCKV